MRKSKEVADWVAAENMVTEAYFRDIPERKTIRCRLTELWKYEKYSPPIKEGGRYFYLRNTGLQSPSLHNSWSGFSWHSGQKVMLNKTGFTFAIRMVSIS